MFRLIGLGEKTRWKVPDDSQQRLSLTSHLLECICPFFQNELVQIGNCKFLSSKIYLSKLQNVLFKLKNIFFKVGLGTKARWTVADDNQQRLSLTLSLSKCICQNGQMCFSILQDVFV